MPEYSFLDARGLGAFEGKSLDALPEVLISERYHDSLNNVHHYSKKKREQSSPESTVA